MLDIKKDRLDYGEMLIPPDGYRLAKAVAATYTLDLNTLLSIPVALFFSQTLEGNFEAERVQILEAIQRCPDVLRVYHQQGKIHIPRKHNRLYGLLEPCVVGIPPKNAYSSFHPKVWVLRYEQDNEPTRYRVIVLSRNLTYDRSWDIAAYLNGKVTGAKQPRVKPLASFIKYLASTPHGDFEGKRKFIADLHKVKFQTPEGFNSSFSFHPMGIGKQSNPVAAQTGNRAICVSPFMHDEAIRMLNENVTDELLLFGRREELRKLDPETLSQPKIDTYCISNNVVDGEKMEKGEDGTGEPLEQNLHAKLYVFQGNTSRSFWFLGSANATKAAFDRNVEFILELQGTSAKAQLDHLRGELLRENEDAQIFQLYEPEEPIDVSETGNQDRKLRELEFNILKLKIKAKVTPSENKTNFDLHLTIHPSSHKRQGMTVKVSPFNSDGVESKNLHEGNPTTLCFRNINESNLSRFLQFEIWCGAEQLREFLVKIEVDGIPDSRVSRILQSVINSSDRFFEYLSFLLEDDNNKGSVGTLYDNTQANSDGETGNIWDMSTPIFEQLLLAASRFPKRLQAIDDIIKQLQKEEGKDSTSSVIPEEFLEFWHGFRQMLRGNSK